MAVSTKCICGIHIPRMIPAKLCVWSVHVMQVANLVIHSTITAVAEVILTPKLMSSQSLTILSISFFAGLAGLKYQIVKRQMLTA